MIVCECFLCRNVMKIINYFLTKWSATKVKSFSYNLISVRIRIIIYFFTINLLHILTCLCSRNGSLKYTVKMNFLPFPPAPGKTMPRKVGIVSCFPRRDPQSCVFPSSKKVSIPSCLSDLPSVNQIPAKSDICCVTLCAGFGWGRANFLDSS